MLKCITLANNLDLFISQASVEDAEQIINFLNKVGGETDFLTFGLNEFPFSVTAEQEIITEILSRNTGLMLVAKINNEIVSQLFLQGSDKPRLAHVADVGISVCKKYWGHSIGRYMMLAAMEWAKNNGFIKLQLWVRVDNERAVQLYKSLGFVVEGTITQAIKIGKTYFDNYIMGLPLSK